MALAERIMELLRSRPGLKAGQIADALGTSRREVNSALHGPLRRRVYQDRAYRWSLADGKPPKEAGDRATSSLNTPLSRLSLYYLDCLGADDQEGISVFASGRHGLDYAELASHPLLDPEGIPEAFSTTAAVELLARMRRDRRRMGLYLGYPVLITRRRGRSGWEGNFVEPLFLHTFEEDSSDRRAPPTLFDEYPQVNLRAFKNLLQSEAGSVMEEVASLQEELGLTDVAEGAPDVDELVHRLTEIRPHWSWRERPDPSDLTTAPQLSDQQDPGIYNRAVLLRGYVNRCVNDIRRRPSQPLSQRRSHPRIERLDRRLRSTQGPSDA